jgi:hypothetical protein
MMARDDEYLKRMEDLDEVKDVIILEEVSKDEWNIERLMKWIDMFKVYNYTTYSHEEVIDFKFRQEREWEEEDKRRFGIK